MPQKTWQDRKLTDSDGPEAYEGTGRVIAIVSKRNADGTREQPSVVILTPWKGGWEDKTDDQYVGEDEIICWITEEDLMNSQFKRQYRKGIRIARKGHTCFNFQ